MLQPDAILFDLDGTFADTAQDLAFALNEVLNSQGKERLAFELIRPVVSKGAPGLLKLGFNLNPGDREYDILRDRLLTIYERNLCRKTVLFKGIEDTIEYLEKNGLPWGIVTNKPEFLTTPLIKQLSLEERASVVISGDTFSEKKPHPMPLLEACRIINIEPQNVWYVGDDERDVIAANAAKMTSVAALWGYFSKKENPENWKATLCFSDATALLNYLKQLPTKI
ncbi:HAD family hydrolase [Pleionea sediminis]|uniref:HAD family hydrolase n=1 Tax=Pleionea sediminis TaxID=2569479 RepID=UPI00118661B6|nr:HAD-IA family hydrolase [Pleionea sediminis]